jgi:hypothetical protein
VGNTGEESEVEKRGGADKRDAKNEREGDRGIGW